MIIFLDVVVVTSKRKIDENTQPRKKIKEEAPKKKNSSQAILIDLTDNNSPIKPNKTHAKEIPTKADEIPSQKVVITFFVYELFIK